MPDIASHNGIDMADIASINGQDVASGAYDPKDDSGTYTEESGTETGIYLYGGFPRYVGHGNNAAGGYVQGPVVNFSSDKDGVFPYRKQTGNFHRNWTKFESSQKIFAGIDTDGKLWMSAINVKYVHQTSNSNTLTQATSVTDVSDDTAWTDVSVGDEFVLAINAGGLYVIGENGDGQLGTGNTTDKATLTHIGSDTDWYKVAAGDDHGAAIKGASGNRSLLTTGENEDGKCGSGDTAGDDTSWTERVAADSGEDWTFVGASRFNSMAILAGKLFMCGDARLELQGNNSISDVLTFTQTGKINSGGDFGTNWVSGATQAKRCTHIINSSNELWFAGEADRGARGDGSSTDAKSGYHIKVSGSGAAGGSDDWTLICKQDPSNGQVKSTFAGICDGQLFTWGNFDEGSQIGHASATISGTMTTATAVANTNTCSYADINEFPDERAVIASFTIS